MNVLVVRQDNNGDVLLAGPAIRRVAARASHVTLLCGPSGAAAAALIPGVDELICLEAPWIEADPHPVNAPAIAAFVTRIASARIDHALIFTSYHQSALPMALVLRLAGVPRISAISVDYAGSLLDLRHRVDEDLHEVERACSLAAAAGFPAVAGDAGRLAMRVAPTNPASHLRPYIVVHPGASVVSRAWAPEKNRALVERLEQSAVRVVVTGSSGERDLCAFVAGTVTTNLAGSTDLATLASVIEAADAIVVGNTGAAHIAAAVNTPVVSLFAPTIPAMRFAPWMVEHVILGDQTIGCAGCRVRTCPLPGQPCLGSVSIEAAVDALKTVVRERSVSPV